MKKYITFANFMVLLGIMTVLFYLIPAVHIEPTTQYTAEVNLFIASFGGSFTMSFSGTPLPLAPCAGLIVAFCLAIVAIVLTFLKSKIKFATLLAFPFYVAAGVLVACGANLVTAANANVGVSNIYSYSLIGGAITVAVFWCLLGFFALVDFIAAIAKPKQQPTAY